MYVLPKKAIEYYGVSDNTLRTWANEGRIKYITTQGGHRRYMLEKPSDNPKPKHQEEIVYARVSSRKQRSDLGNQTDYLTEKYPGYKVVTDIGSGINFERPGFKRILEGVFEGTIKKVVVAHRDRFTRFGYQLFEWIFSKHGALLISDQESQGSEHEELSEDLMAIITVFSARYHGKRKYTRKNELL